jgi:pimeloyl-ACP methyl ester carboxylesterase
MTTTTSGYAPIASGQMFYELAGSGPPVVLIHGFGVDRRMWEHQVEAFADRYTVVACDLRGFGHSSVPEGPYAHHDDVVALLDHLGLRRASLVGSSMGGRISMDIGVTHPDRVQLIISADGMPSGLSVRAPGTSRLPDRDQYERTLRSLSPERKARFKGIVADYSRWHRKNFDPRIEVDPPVAGRLHELAIPTLIVVGEDDAERFHQAADRAAAGIPGARKHVIAGSGHLPNLEAPEEFNRIVLDFLAHTIHD